jgi:NADH-quinone oxidoreductase subunit A
MIAFVTPGPLATSEYAPVLILILLIVGLVGLILALTHIMGPRRHGPTKDETYEAGMPVIGDARRRFNVRFYIVAMLFLLFDVEVVFLWPWALVFHDVATGGNVLSAGHQLIDATFLLGAMGFFVGLLLVGFAYELGKGAFKWS